jgi:hypothetical protein
MTAKVPTNEKVNGQKIRCYDNEGRSYDRYTVIYMSEPEKAHNTYASVDMSSAPFHPQGFGQHGTATPGKHLGKRIRFEDLPEDCKKLVRRDLTNQEDNNNGTTTIRTV